MLLVPDVIKKSSVFFFFFFCFWIRELMPEKCEGLLKFRWIDPPQTIFLFK